MADDHRFTSLGKEVLENGVHYADTMSPESARFICVCLNYVGTPTWQMAPEDALIVLEHRYGQT